MPMTTLLLQAPTILSRPRHLALVRELDRYSSRARARWNMVETDPHYDFSTSRVCS